ncbi:MAG: pyridoxal phosphate-dependent aminotransferase [Desulfovibrio sp.]|nr:pyridoxal phosphate-dependent aminotransferase [Desulfovibrio sp.]
MQISEKVAQIQPSMTLAINARAQELRAQGIEVVSLAVGEPDFPTPEFIKEAAKRAIDDNFTRYTAIAGIPELRQAAADWLGKRFRSEVKAENIIIGSGGKQCIYTFLQTMLNPGDEVLIPSPYWVSYPDMTLLADGKPVFVKTDAKTGYKVAPLMLEEYVTERTKALILNSPSNPTGAVYSDREFMNVMRWALAHNIYVLSDEIYDQLIYPPAAMTSAVTWFEHCPEYVGVVNGLSKSYAMTGWRVGFMAAHPEIIKKMSVVQGHSLSNVCSIAQKAALAALTGPQDCVAEMRSAFEKRRDLAMERIGTWKKAVCPRPDGAFYLFVDASGYYKPGLDNSVAFCKWLLERAHVAVVPGVAFGDDKCFRISFAVGDDRLRDALDRVGEALASL